MDDKRFAAACAAIETIAINNQLMLLHHYDTSREDVQEIVNMARVQWFEKKTNHRKEK